MEAMAPLASLLIENQDLKALEKILPTLTALREFLDQDRNAVDGLG